MSLNLIRIWKQILLLLGGIACDFNTMLVVFANRFEQLTFIRQRHQLHASHQHTKRLVGSWLYRSRQQFVGQGLGTM